MPRGGKRPGSGRKPGGKCQKIVNRLKLAEDAAAGGITPLALILEHMRDLWAEGTKESKAEAAKLAVDAAPFIHPRLTAVDMTTDQLVEHIVRVPAKAENPETWLADYMQPPQDETVQ
jgi:hypothetical protein